MVVCFQTLSFSKIDNHVTAELFLLESPDEPYFPKSGGSTFLKTVGSHFFLKSAETKLLLTISSLFNYKGGI